MPDNNNDQLIIDIGARIVDLQKSMDDANSVVSKGFTEIEQRGQIASDKLNASLATVGNNKSLTLLSQGFLTAEKSAGALAQRLSDMQKKYSTSKGMALGQFGVGQGASAYGLLQQVQNAGSLSAFTALSGGALGVGALAAGYAAEQTKQLSDLKALADQSRATTAEVVGLQNIFGKLGLTSDQTGKLIKTFASNLLDARANGGALKAALDAAGISFTQADGNLRPTIAVLQDLITHMRASKDQIANVTLAARAFGPELSGPFVNAVKQGGTALNNLQASAHSAGSAITDDLAKMAAHVMHILTSLWDGMDKTYSRAKEMMGMPLTGKDQANLADYHLEMAGDDLADAQKGGSAADIKAAWQRYFDAGRQMAKENPVATLQGGYPIKPAVPKPIGPDDDDDPDDDDVPAKHGRGGGKSNDDDDKATDAIAKLKQELALIQTTGAAHDALAEKIKIENALKEAGVSADSADGKAITNLIKQTDAATEAEKKHKAALDDSKKAADAIGQSLESGVENLLLNSGKLSDLFKNLANEIAKMAIQAAFLGTGSFGGLFSNATGTSGGIFGGLTKLLGFAGGGEIAGPGSGTSDSILARVSAGEFIVNEKSAAANLDLLHAINGTGPLPKFASGGQVGAISTPSFGGASSSGAGKFELHNNVTVNASGGTPAQNDDLAKKMSAQLEVVMRQTVVGELRKQMRPGNLLENVRHARA